MNARIHGNEVRIVAFLSLLAVLFTLALSPQLNAHSQPIGPRQSPASRLPLAPEAVVNLIANGDFSSGLNPWWSNNVTASVVSGEMEGVVPDTAANPWDAIIGQGGLPIQAGESYTLSLQIRATTPVTVSAIIQLDAAPYTQYFNGSLKLTPINQVFNFPFTASTDDPAAVFQIQLGGQGGYTFYLDNVALLGPEPVAPPPAEVGELLLNGDFSDGLGPWWTTDSVNPDTSSGELQATIINGGSNVWDVIIGQHNIPVYAGSAYTLTLTARASSAHTVTMLLQQNGGAYTQYFGTQLPLTTTSQDFAFYFTSPNDDPAATFQFQMGGQGEFTAYLDNISLLGPKPAAQAEVLPAVRLNQTGYLTEAPNAPRLATRPPPRLNGSCSTGQTRR